MTILSILGAFFLVEFESTDLGHVGLLFLLLQHTVVRLWDTACIYLKEDVWEGSPEKRAVKIHTLLTWHIDLFTLRAIDLEF